MINVAVIGVGYWGPNLARNLSAISKFRVRTICDSIVDRARTIQQHHCPGADVVENFESVIADPAIDAVVVATPISSHFEIAHAALKAGKHVLVEKPLARTVAECDELIDLADANKLVLMVGHVFEFSNAVIKVKKYLVSGEIGSVFYIHGQRVNLGRIQVDLNA
ncbi:MAG TPA: Gfo/Idh/MocA family oxidoreductase, partial [Steroidobacteraceae bacterium]|nr:Gfo/Idh/MocA family oxidoreductase [Steroidobacteraceae bacterium]